MQVSHAAPTALCTVAALLGPSCSGLEERPAAPAELARSADGVSIAFEARGRGAPALVFVHGWCGERSLWRGTMEAFEASHRVLALDLGGHGASGAGRERWTLDALAADVVAVCDQADLADLILVGHSMGAPVALLAAAELRGRVRGVIGVDSLHDVDFVYAPGFLEGVAQGLEQDYSGALEASFRGVAGPGLARERLDWLLSRAAHTDRAAAIGLLRGLGDFDLEAALGAAGVPVRVVNAAPRPGATLATEVERNRRAADFEALFLADAGHFPMLETPTRFGALLARWVDELSAAPLPR